MVYQFKMVMVINQDGYNFLTKVKFSAQRLGV